VTERRLGLTIEAKVELFDPCKT